MIYTPSLNPRFGELRIEVSQLARDDLTVFRWTALCRQQRLPWEASVPAARRMMKLAFMLIYCVTAFCALASDLTWHTNLAKAMTEARAETKMILLHFTGSDWCEDCKNLNLEVLKTAEFREYARTNFVLMEIDLPISKPQSAVLKKANETLAEKHDVYGWPTLVLLDAKGELIDKLIGYRKGAGQKEVIAKLESFRKRVLREQ